MVYGIWYMVVSGISISPPTCVYIYMRGISVQTVHDPKMSKISKFRGWPWDGYSVVEDA